MKEKMNCKHYAWDIDDEGTRYCTYCDVNLSEEEEYMIKKTCEECETSEGGWHSCGLLKLQKMLTPKGGYKT